MSNANSNRRRRPNFKGKAKTKPNDKFENTKRTEKDCANDPDWYIRAGQLAKDVASISFNNALGAPITVDPDAASAFHIGAQKYSFNAPGVMSIHTVPAPGYSNGYVSAINIAAKNLYSFVRHANAGHPNYDAPDLMMYIIAMDSMFNLIYDMQRALGLAQLFSQRNRYIGDALIRACGYQQDDLRANIAQYRARLNMLIVKASVFAVPKDYTLFKRHSWMYSNVFADAPVDKCQFYAYIPSVAYKLVETEGPGYLEPILNHVGPDTSTGTLGHVPLTFGQVIAKAEEVMATLQGSEDINIMSGDILKAYGRENLYILGLVPETYTIMPIYSEEVLDQIHNTRFAGNKPVKGITDYTEASTYSTESLRITQDASVSYGALYFKPVFNGGQNLAYEPIIDMTDNDPTPERVLVATRNVISGVCHRLDGDGGASTWATEVNSFASDIPMFATMYRINESGSFTIGTLYSNAVAGPLASNLPYLRMFRKAPLLYTGVFSDNNSVYTPNVPYGDIENYTVVSKDTIDYMHQNAILSMLGVPA